MLEGAFGRPATATRCGSSPRPWTSAGSRFERAVLLKPEFLGEKSRVGEHGIGADPAAERKETARRMELRQARETGGEEWVPIPAGSCIGSEAFRKELLGRVEGRLGDHHTGEWCGESAEARPKRIVADELERLGWTAADLRRRRRKDPDKLRIAARLRRETTLTVAWIAARRDLGTRKGASSRRQEWKRSAPERALGS